MDPGLIDPRVCVDVVLQPVPQMQGPQYRGVVRVSGSDHIGHVRWYSCPGQDPVRLGRFLWIFTSLVRPGYGDGMTTILRHPRPGFTWDWWAVDAQGFLVQFSGGPAPEHLLGQVERVDAAAAWAEENCPAWFHDGPPPLHVFSCNGELPTYTRNGVPWRSTCSTTAARRSRPTFRSPSAVWVNTLPRLKRGEPWYEIGVDDPDRRRARHPEPPEPHRVGQAGTACCASTASGDRQPFATGRSCCPGPVPGRRDSSRSGDATARDRRGRTRLYVCAGP